MTSGPQLISSRDNVLLKDLRKLAQDNTAYRKQGQVWIEGDHLCRAAVERGVMPAMAVYSESGWRDSPKWVPASAKAVVVADVLFAGLSGLESPAPMAFVIDLPSDAQVMPGVATVILDRVQDAGNVGSILRSASAFGFRQVVALKGSAALWSPKVLRAGMGAHFGLHLAEGVGAEALQGLGVPIMVTSSHEGAYLHQQEFPRPCAWALGHEGQGVSQALSSMAERSVRIAQPGGEESLNVAAAAAICLHASMMS
ncbi:MAG: RNA methyltransferase [Comamonadaceae bacterium]|nr:MAG: RNA methyltransferase [Comamonadaceae bacterium]